MDAKLNNAIQAGKLKAKQEQEKERKKQEEKEKDAFKVAKARAKAYRKILIDEGKLFEWIAIEESKGKRQLYLPSPYDRLAGALAVKDVEGLTVSHESGVGHDPDTGSYDWENVIVKW